MQTASDDRGGWWPVNCPYCGSDMPGGATKCACGYDMMTAPVPAPQPPTAGYCAQPQDAYSWEADRQRILGKLVAPGIANLVVGGLVLAWVGMCVVEIVMISTGALDQQLMAGPSPPPKEAMYGMFAGMGVLSLLTAALQAATGIMMLRKKGAIRIMGIVTGIVSLVSVWAFCCGWPLCVAVGAWTLIVVLNAEVKWALEG